MKTFEQLETNKKSKGKIFYSDGTEETVRFAKEDDITLFIYAKGSRRYGRRSLYTNGTILYKGKEILGFKKCGKTEEEKWLYSINRAIKILEESGLWSDYLSNLRIAKEIGYEKIQKAYSIYWTDFTNDYKENKEIVLEKIKELDERLIEKYDGEKEKVKTSIIWYMRRPLIIKKMYFGKADNEICMQNIAESIRENKEVSVWGRSNYDVSFEYNPEANKAWYSEEYKGCGNGHYYLALSDKYAMFYEDD